MRLQRGHGRTILRPLQGGHPKRTDKAGDGLGGVFRLGPGCYGLGDSQGVGGVFGCDVSDFAGPVVGVHDFLDDFAERFAVINGHRSKSSC